MLRCHSVPDCSSPSSHRRGHPCRKTFGIFACFPSLNLLMQKHIMNSGQKFCLVVIFRSPSSSNLVFLLLCIDCMVCTSMPFQSLTWQNPASAWCLPCVATNLRNKLSNKTNCTKFGYWVEEFTSRSPPNGNVYTPHESGNISPGITGWLGLPVWREMNPFVVEWRDPKIMMGFWNPHITV